MTQKTCQSWCIRILYKVHLGKSSQVLQYYSLHLQGEYYITCCSIWCWCFQQLICRLYVNMKNIHTNKTAQQCFKYRPLKAYLAPPGPSESEYWHCEWKWGGCCVIVCGVTCTVHVYRIQNFNSFNGCVMFVGEGETFRDSWVILSGNLGKVTDRHCSFTMTIRHDRNYRWSNWDAQIT